MDITSKNFVENYPFIKKSIETADFVSFDFEFSGLSTCVDDVLCDHDCDEVRYQKLKNTVQRMYAFQIGIATFIWDQENMKYVSRPFNIYLFPHSPNQININGIQKILQFSTSCLKFNLRNKFDFNKLFSSGINYRQLTSERAQVLSLIEQRVDIIMANETNGTKKILIPEAQLRMKNCLCKED